MIVFLDASALAKRYLQEAGSDRVRKLFRKHANIALSRLSEVEVTSALIRRMNAGDLEEEVVDAHLATLLEVMGACDVVEPRQYVVTRARELVREHGLMAYDALQLASALRVRSSSALTFLCAAGELADAAEAERLRVDRVG